MPAQDFCGAGRTFVGGIRVGRAPAPAFGEISAQEPAISSDLFFARFGSPPPSHASQHVATTTWSLAALRFYRTDVMDCMAQHMLSQDLLSGMTVMDVANILWGYASLGIKNLPLVKKLGAQVLQPNMLQGLDFEVCCRLVLWDSAVEPLTWRAGIPV